MKYIKYTIGIVAIFSILFLIVESVKSVREHNALIKAEELAAYGPSGKPKELVQQSAEMPDDWNIRISGDIEKGINYKVIVSYHSNSDSAFCKEWGLFSFILDRSSVELYTYYPKIYNGRHDLWIPLTEHNPKKGCKYRVREVVLSLDRIDKDFLLPSARFDLFYPRWAITENKLNPPGYGFSRRQQDSKTLNIECVFPDPENIYYSASPCGLAPVQDAVAVSQQLPTYNATYEVNINFITQEAYRLSTKKSIR